MTTLTETMRADILRMLSAREPFARFSDGVYAIALDERDAYYLLVYPGTDGAARAARALSRADALRRTPDAPIARVWMNLSELGNGGEGILLAQGPRTDRCRPLVALDVDVRAAITERVRADIQLRDAPDDDVWVNMLGPTPFLIRADRVPETA